MHDQCVPAASSVRPEAEPPRCRVRRGVLLECLLVLMALALLLAAPEPSRALAGSVKQAVAQASLEPRAPGHESGLRWTGRAIACPWPGAAVRK